MEKNNNEQTNGLVAKWGDKLFDDGITNLPECFAKYGIRFITPGEFVFIVEIFSYQYSSDLPYPSQKTIADNMEIGVRQVKKYVSSLEEKGLLQVYYRYEDGKRTSNEYSFKPLLDKCLQVSIDKKTRKERTKNTKRVAKSTRGTTGSPSELSAPQGHLGLVPQGHLGLDSEGHLGLVPQGHPNKESEERNLEERNINNVCVDDSHRKELLNLIDSREDLKPHTHELLTIFDSVSKDKTFKPDVFLKTVKKIDLRFGFDFKYLRTSLMNNLKKGFVYESTPGSKRNSKPIRQEQIPAGYEDNQRQWEEAANESNLTPGESIEEKRKRLEALQAQFKADKK